MRLPTINTASGKLLVRLMSLTMIAVFITLGIIARQANESKLSESKVFEKSKKSATESDFLLFEEDDELSDKNESDPEWIKDFSFHLLAGATSPHLKLAGLTNLHYSFNTLLQVSNPTPLYINARSLRI